MKFSRFWAIPNGPERTPKNFTVSSYLSSYIYTTSKNLLVPLAQELCNFQGSFISYTHTHTVYSKYYDGKIFFQIYIFFFSAKAKKRKLFFRKIYFDQLRRRHSLCKNICSKVCERHNGSQMNKIYCIKLQLQ